MKTAVIWESDEVCVFIIPGDLREYHNVYLDHVDDPVQNRLYHIMYKDIGDSAEGFTEPIYRYKTLDDLSLIKECDHIIIAGEFV